MVGDIKLSLPMTYIYVSRNELVNTLRLRQNDHYFPDDIFKWIFVKENAWILIKISLKFIPKGPVDNIPAMVQIMAWCRPGDTLLSESIMAWVTDIYASLSLNELIVLVVNEAKVKCVIIIMLNVCPYMHGSLGQGQGHTQCMWDPCHMLDRAEIDIHIYSTHRRSMIHEIRQTGQFDNTRPILGLHPANERHHYKVKPSLIGWAGRKPRISPDNIYWLHKLLF